MGASNICSLAAFPVEYLAFDVEQIVDGVSLSWATAFELDNDFFLIEKSIDGNTWDGIGQVQGTGNSLEPVGYEFIDTKPVIGQNFYRLKQVDLNGDFSYSPIKSIINSLEGVFEVSAYPNPLKMGENLTVLIPNANEIKQLTIRVLDLRGQTVYEKELYASTLTKNHGLVDISPELLKGTYVLVAETNSLRNYYKIMVR